MVVCKSCFKYISETRYYDFGSQGAYHSKCMKCVICGSEANFDSRYLFYGKGICASCFDLRNQEAKEIGNSQLSITCNFESMTGTAGSFFRLIVDVPPTLKPVAVADLVKLTFAKMNVGESVHSAVYETRAIFEWFERVLNREDFQNSLTEALLARKDSDIILAAPARAFRYNYFRTTNIYDGSAVWRCIYCTADFDTESAVRTHEVANQFLEQP